MSKENSRKLLMGAAAALGTCLYLAKSNQQEDVPPLQLKTAQLNRQQAISKSLSGRLIQTVQQPAGWAQACWLLPVI